ncbi:hypothetical protein BBF96_03155 [Anoxybacter fermentans]|uniref:Lipoyl-binding domain-containing protein n=1 Tax=Anoxybacter fermentans TaxID=1323375 RepID=A0A3Q9HP47_9FIRM|nr:biotin/lipoyl-containing protein [Anoxybacter fermentans]AZR72466.1 hypothetical protein BBF96_03155 [Anoxybacter fermentans]
MKKYLVKVDDEEFVVQIRLLEEEEKNTAADKESVSESKPESHVETKTAPVSGEEVKAPLGGTILKINVQVGSKVKTGDLLMTLEALKLENEITAPCDGTVAEILITEGATVEIGETLIIINKE